MLPARPDFRPRTDRTPGAELLKSAQELGFVGRVEYRHVNSQAGGAQFGLAADPAADLLIVYAEAFQEDADPDDFSIEAIFSMSVATNSSRIARN